MRLLQHSRFDNLSTLIARSSVYVQRRSMRSYAWKRTDAVKDAEGAATRERWLRPRRSRTKPPRGLANLTVCHIHNAALYPVLLWKRTPLALSVSFLLWFR